MKVSLSVDRCDIAERKWNPIIRDDRIASIGLDDRIDGPVKDGIIRCECLSSFVGTSVTKRPRLGSEKWHRLMEPMGVRYTEVIIESGDRFIASQGY